MVPRLAAAWTTRGRPAGDGARWGAAVAAIRRRRTGITPGGATDDRTSADQRNVSIGGSVGAPVHYAALVVYTEKVVISERDWSIREALPDFAAPGAGVACHSAA